MGGICGFIGASDRSLLEKMSYAIRHRGTHKKIFMDKDVSLSSRSHDGEDELAVNEDGSVWVVFDGEIFNKNNLENALKADGHVFSSVCNSELLAHLYEKLGDSCVNKLRGSFAFALWDTKEKLLLLARDRIGEKSIYYALFNGIFLFASEIKSILCFEEVRKKLDMRSLDSFFTWGHVPAPNTLFYGIYKMSPSYLLKYKRNKITLSRYWKLDFSNIEDGLDEDDWCKRIYDILIDSVHIRLRKGPFGISLGGLDSSTLASLMRKLTDEPIKSFTVNFEDETFNEPYARYVADWLGIEAYEKTLYAKDLIRILPELVRLFDDLKIDIAPTLPTFISLEMAKEHVRTMFTADGADNYFWSWGWDHPGSFTSKAFTSKVQTLTSKLPPINKILDPILHTCKSYISPTNEGKNMIMHALWNFDYAIRTANIPVDMRPLYFWQYYHDDELQELLGRHTLVNLYAPFFECVEYPANDLGSKINRMRLILKAFELIGGWGLDRLGDICSGFSLRLRTPYEDYKLRELTAKIPPYLKQPNEHADKYIFRKTILKYSLLPKQIVKQRKFGFGWGLYKLVPHWFKGELKDYTEQTIIENIKRVKPILKERAIMKYLRKGKAIQVLSLLMFVLWYKRFFSDARA